MTQNLSHEQANYVDAAPVSASGIVRRALEGTASPRQAIKAMCLACNNFERAEIADCAVALCLLRAYRPYQKPKDNVEDFTGEDLPA